MVGINPIAFIANFLDPKWKLLALELSGQDGDAIKSDVLEMMKASVELMATLRQKMSQYFSKGFLPMTKDSNPISWWKDNQHLFPNLEAIAKQYLAV